MADAKARIGATTKKRMVRTVVAGVLATTAVLCGTVTASAATQGDTWQIRGDYHSSPDLGQARAAADKDIPALIARCVSAAGSYVRSEVSFRETTNPTGWMARAVVTCRGT